MRCSRRPGSLPGAAPRDGARRRASTLVGSHGLGTPVLREACGPALDGHRSRRKHGGLPRRAASVRRSTGRPEGCATTHRLPRSDGSGRAARGPASVPMLKSTTRKIGRRQCQGWPARTPPQPRAPRSAGPRRCSSGRCRQGAPTAQARQYVGRWGSREDGVRRGAPSTRAPPPRAMHGSTDRAPRASPIG